MSLPHGKMGNGLWVVFLLGVFSSIVYAGSVALVVIFPDALNKSVLVWITDKWGVIGGIYLFLQILPIISRPVNKDGWEITDNITSYIPAAVLMIGAPLVYGVRGYYGLGDYWPNHWAWEVAHMSFWFSLCDVMLTQVSYKISRAVGRIATA